MADKNIIRDWEMSAKTRPDKIEDMALSPSIKSLLLNWEKGRVIKHCIMHGHSGTGKTTSARIIAPLIDKQFEEINCTTDGSKDEIINIGQPLIDGSINSHELLEILFFQWLSVIQSYIFHLQQKLSSLSEILAYF